MLKKALLLGIGLTCLAAALPAAAQERATFVLTNGERQDGAIVYGREDNNIVDGNFHLNAGGADRSYPMNNVAVIDFGGGNPAGDLNSLPSDNAGLMVMRNGQTTRGHLHNIIKGDLVQWVNDAGQRNNIPIRDVSRLYLNTQVARSVFGPTAAVGTSGQELPPTAIRIEGTQFWVNTGITVRKGDQVSFNATGNITAYPGASAGVAGSPIMATANLPLKSAPGASLIGRIGNGAPFAIGSNPNPITMPAAGQLQVGINDDNVADNTGYFLVAITAPQRPSLFQRR